MKRVEFDKAVRSGRTLVFHYIGSYFPCKLDSELELLKWRLSFWPLCFECVAAVETADVDEAYRCTQDTGTHRSTCNGDLVRTPDGRWWLCLHFGWQNVTAIIKERIYRSA